MASSDLASICESEFEKWSEESGSDKIFLIECKLQEDGNVLMQLLLHSEYEVKLHIPAGYPNYEGTNNSFLVEASPAIHLWCNTLNQYLLDASSQLSISDVLCRAVSFFGMERRTGNQHSISSDDDDDTDDEHEMNQDEAPSDDDQIFTTEWELLVARKKKRWRQKESQLREEIKKSKNGDVKRTNFLHTSHDKVRQIFSFPAASGILVNDLVTVMQHENETGISAEAVDDNIYKWIVKLSKFQLDSPLQKDLVELERRYEYDYIELQMEFAMDLYPFYPPLVKVIRPRLRGLHDENLTSFDLLKKFQLSYWNPAHCMKRILEEVKEFLESTVRIEMDNKRNDKKWAPSGAYFNVEHILLRMGVVSEVSPRGDIFSCRTVRKMNNFFKPETKETRKCTNKEEYWAKGTGYGYGCRPGWDMDAYVAAQQEKDRQIEKVLYEILSELQNLRQTRNTSTTVEGCSSAQLENQGIDVSKTSCAQRNDKHTSSSEDNMEVDSSTCVVNGDSDAEDMYYILEGSALIPFIEQHLEVDSFLEVCRHLGLYKAILETIREIARQPFLVQLLGHLPKQKLSLYGHLKILAEKSNFILERLGKVTANGCIPGMTGSSREDSEEMIFGQTDVYNVVQETADEKLAREFSALYTFVTDAFEKRGIATENAANDDSPGVETMYCTPSTSLSCSKDDLMEKLYRETLKPLQFQSHNIEINGTNSHHFCRSFKSDGQGTPQQIIRVAQELCSLSTSLPLDLSSSIFVRTDEDKCTLMRALITGPEGTPYSSGCFVFDFYFPPLFPKSPPVVNFRTTGGGRVRFNPNLYECGKVCLSLLGTWPGLQGEHWHETSTVLQVLVSIQSLILVANPYFNEPGYERMIGSEKGSKQSTAYNYEVCCNCIKHAMLAQLREPVPGFEDVIRAHFYIKKQKIIKEVESWLKPSNPRGQLSQLVEELKVALKNLERPKELPLQAGV